MLVNVTADWCDPCHEMERTTYRNPQVIEASHAFLMVKLDATDPDRPLVGQFLDRYHVEGAPTVLIFDARGRERRDLRRDGYLSAGELLSVMRAPQR